MPALQEDEYTEEGQAAVEAAEEDADEVGEGHIWMFVEDGGPYLVVMEGGTVPTHLCPNINEGVAWWRLIVWCDETLKMFPSFDILEGKVVVMTWRGELDFAGRPLCGGP